MQAGNGSPVCHQDLRRNNEYPKGRSRPDTGRTPMVAIPDMVAAADKSYFGQKSPEILVAGSRSDYNDLA